MRDDELLSEGRRLAEQLELPDPEFAFVIGWPGDYEDLFAGVEVPDSETDTRALLEVALRVGRVLLHGEGGTGKSTIVRRLFKHAFNDDLFPVLVNMRRWNASTNIEWEESRGNEIQRANLLLQLGQPATNEAHLAQAIGARRPVLLVDGLNEAPGPVPDGILTALDAFARRNPHAGVVVTDRVVRRRLPGESWRLANVVRAELTGDEPRPPGGLMQMAFFLNLKLHGGLDSSSSSRAFRAYFESHVGLAGVALLPVAHAAYDAYQSVSARVFPYADFAATAGRAATRSLLAAGTLVRDNGDAHFLHHLFHDFLAGLWLAGERRRWDSAIFDALTFGASSFDVLALALEEIERSEDADALLRSIYDWNYYGSAYALSKGRGLGTVVATESMELALLAMLAERRWDPLAATAQRVEDALRLFPGPRARQFLATRRRDDVVTLIEHATLSQQFDGWRALFTMDDGARVTDDVVDELVSTESLIGWTAANVLKRVALTSHQRYIVRSLLADCDNYIVRWRAAHVLGAVHERAAIDVLFTALDDSYPWVRYGAVRSLVEMAACDSKLRTEVFDRLKVVILDLAGDPMVIGEFERAIVLRNPPPGWIASLAPIIEELWGAAETLDEQDHWRDVALRVRRQAMSV